jgi:hypothetical protein
MHSSGLRLAPLPTQNITFWCAIRGGAADSGPQISHPRAASARLQHQSRAAEHGHPDRHHSGEHPLRSKQSVGRPLRVDLSRKLTRHWRRVSLGRKRCEVRPGWPLLAVPEFTQTQKNMAIQTPPSVETYRWARVIRHQEGTNAALVAARRRDAAARLPEMTLVLGEEAIAPPSGSSRIMLVHANATTLRRVIQRLPNSLA